MSARTWSRAEFADWSSVHTLRLSGERCDGAFYVVSRPMPKPEERAAAEREMQAQLDGFLDDVYPYPLPGETREQYTARTAKPWQEGPWHS